MITNILEKRRSYYAIGRDVKVSEKEIEESLGEILQLSPSAFNSQDARMVIAFGEHHNMLWDIVLEEVLKLTTPQGAEETKKKIAGFKAGFGTVLFFEEQDTIKGLQDSIPAYADNFPIWAEHANGMVQVLTWLRLRELELGASLQHYNPLIDEKVAELFKLPKSWKLRAQMPFGNILEEPESKDKLPLAEKLKVLK